MSENEVLLEFLYLTPMGMAKTDVKGVISLMNPVLNNILMQIQDESCFSSSEGKEAPSCYVHNLINMIDFFSLYDETFKEQIDGGLKRKEQTILKHYDIHVKGKRIEYIRVGCVRLTTDMLIFTVEDITELKKSELALMQSREELRKSNAMKDKLFSIIGHDLRGPIGALSTALEMMIEEPENFGKDDMMEILEMLQRSSKASYLLLENLLYWARSQMGDITYIPETFNLNNLISEKLDLLKLQSEEKKITMEADFSGKAIKCYADKNMIETVVRNILSNALKFTPLEGTVTVQVKAQEEIVSVVTQDTGIGMNREQLETLFDLSRNFSARGTGGEKGTGLGLYLCKEFMEQNRGTLSVTSSPGKGTKVTFTLPLTR